ncbi:MAG: hypothetical protein PHC51_00575 [bacterium]|nr:hypothetical protein [bacterium]
MADTGVVGYSGNVGATLVASVLENAGYVTQGYMLDAFEPWFHSGGQLVLLLAAAAGIAAVLAFGSFRMAGYLLFAPGMFYFLLYSRTGMEEVRWKVGSGEVKSVQDQYNGYIEKYKFPEEQLQLPWFFVWFTKLASDMTNTLTQVILNELKDPQITFVARNELLNIVRNAVPNDDITYKLLTDALYGSCAPLTNAYMKLSDPELSGGNLNKLQLGSMANDYSKKEYERLTTVKNELLSKRNEFLERNITPSLSVREYACDKLAAFPSGSGQTTEPGYAKLEEYCSCKRAGGSICNMASGQDQFTCGDAFDITKDAIRDDMSKLVAKIKEVPPGLGDAANSQVSEETYQTLCYQVQEKLYGINNREQLVGGVDEDCSLVDVMSVFALRNVLSAEYSSQQSSLQGSINNHLKNFKERAGYVSGENHRIATGLPQIDSGGQITADTKRYGLHHIEPGLGGHMVEFGDDGKKRTVFQYGDRMEKQETQDVEIMGQFEASFKANQTFFSKSMVQEIYTYSMNVPYWQGVILFLLSIAYPLFSVVILVPGQAPSFFYLPLAWLWVKSWDVGFAMVMVLDQVLWNLMPSTEHAFSDINQTCDKADDCVINALQAVLSVDPTYHVQVHNSIVGLAMSMVPPMTAAVLLGAKRGMVSSFTEPLENAAKEAAAMQQLSEALPISTARQEQTKGPIALAAMAPYKDGGVWDQAYNYAFNKALPIVGAGKAIGAIKDIQGKMSPAEMQRLTDRFKSANSLADLSAADQKAATDLFRKITSVQGLGAVGSAGLEAWSDAMGLAKNYASAAAEFQSVHDQYFAEYLGKYGHYASNMQSAAAALDVSSGGLGFGSFEIPTTYGNAEFYDSWRKFEMATYALDADAWQKAVSSGAASDFAKNSPQESLYKGFLKGAGGVLGAGIAINRGDAAIDELDLARKGDLADDKMNFGQKLASNLKPSPLTSVYLNESRFFQPDKQDEFRDLFFDIAGSSNILGPTSVEKVPGDGIVDWSGGSGKIDLQRVKDYSDFQESLFSPYVSGLQGMDSFHTANGEVSVMLRPEESNGKTGWNSLLPNDWYDIPEIMGNSKEFLNIGDGLTGLESKRAVIGPDAGGN